MCAIFGAVAKRLNLKIVDDVILGLYHQQHRGQESAGIAYTDTEFLRTEKGFGLVSSVFDEKLTDKIKSVMPMMMIAQTRYSTSKTLDKAKNSTLSIPPQWVHVLRGRFALIHNGNIPYIDAKNRVLSSLGVKVYKTDNDTAYMLKYILCFAEKHDWDLIAGISEFINSTSGTYSAALLSEDAAYLFRDPWSNRPFFWTETEDGFYFGSETCAFSDITKKRLTTVEGGQIIKLTPKGPPEIYQARKERPAHCVLEHIYFARPDSLTYGREIEDEFRFRSGIKLAELFPLPEADIITYMPESGKPAGEGFAFHAKKPLRAVYIRDSYLPGRGFIAPRQEERARYSKMKYHLMSHLVKDKKVVMVDDTIMRMITLAGKVVEMKEAGAKEVHIRIAAPPTISPCFYGIDMPSREELVASHMSKDEIRDRMRADSLEYLSLDALNTILEGGGQNPDHYCKACFDGSYPIPMI